MIVVDLLGKFLCCLLLVFGPMLVLRWCLGVAMTYAQQERADQPED